MPLVGPLLVPANPCMSSSCHGNPRVRNAFDPTKYTTVHKFGAGVVAEIPSFEVESPIYTGERVANYTKGAEIQVKVKNNAGHQGGPHSFHICEASYKKDPTQECLDSNPLEFVKTGLFEDDLFNNVDEQIRNIKTYTVRLPEDLTCDHCVIQWKWIAKATNQLYHSCADVRIRNV